MRGWHNETTRRRDGETTRRRDDETTRRRDDETTRRRDDETTRRQDDETTRRRDNKSVAHQEATQQPAAQREDELDAQQEGKEKGCDNKLAQREDKRMT
jgi:hypothetical protein